MLAPLSKLFWTENRVGKVEQCHAKWNGKLHSSAHFAQSRTPHQDICRHSAGHDIKFSVRHSVQQHIQYVQSFWKVSHQFSFHPPAKIASSLRSSDFLVNWRFEMQFQLRGNMKKFALFTLCLLAAVVLSAGSPSGVI